MLMDFVFGNFTTIIYLQAKYQMISLLKIFTRPCNLDPSLSTFVKYNWSLPYYTCFLTLTQDMYRLWVLVRTALKTIH